MIRQSEPTAKGTNPYWNRFSVSVFPDRRGQMRKSLFPLVRERPKRLGDFD